MKSLQFLFINALTLIIGLGLMSGSFSPSDAQAAPTEVVPKIQIQKIGNFKGQHLTVFYAVGTRPFLSTDSSQVTLSEVKSIRTQVVDDDFVTLPQIELQKAGFRPGYNLVLVVISPNPDYSFVNANGETIVGMPQTKNQQASLIRSYSKAEIESLATGQGLPDGLVLTLQ
ncbi:hypothetical protein [Bdellovibrio sp. HCB337]|uniref:hypothetical protein n=1 Tax=Bdellovibrio sp. HCB337 TaxID=3394358 RepID=UPI0039A6A500